MDDFYDFQESFSYRLLESKCTTSPIPLPLRESKINFKFSFQFDVSEWILSEDDESQLVSQSNNPAIDYVVSAGLDRLLSIKETRKYMQEKLSGLRVNSDDRRNLVDYALYEACKWITECCDTYPGGGVRCRVLSLHFNVLLEHEYIYLDEEINNYGSPTSIRMVPAKDSSIQVLKKVEVAGYSRRTMDCSICLEKLFDDGCYREALSMPCSHVFHGDCIKNWLRVSHYCPLCRFEMPIN